MMSRFDAAAARLAAAWGFGAGVIELKEKVWRGGKQGEEIRTSAGDLRQYLRIEHDELFLTLHVSTYASAEEIIGLLDLVAEAIGKGGETGKA